MVIEFFGLAMSYQRGSLVRLIYIDEAGTSPAEPVRLVCGVIVNADKDYMTLCSEMNRIAEERVPQKYKDRYNEKYGKFVFHCKDLVNRGNIIDKDDPEWPLQDRLDFVKEVLCLPRVHDAPIAFGIVHKGQVEGMPSDFFSEDDAAIDRTLYENMLALAYCVDRADWFLRHHLGGSEIGTLTCEDVSSNKELLRKAATIFRHDPLYIPTQVKNLWQEQCGIEPPPVKLEIKHIIDTPNYVAKTDAPLLQLADGCAFAFRRRLSKQQYGDDLIYALLGEQEGAHIVKEPSWYAKTSSGLLNTYAYWPDDKKKEWQEMMRVHQALDALGLREDYPDVT